MYTMFRIPVRLGLALLMALALQLVGCGGGDDGAQAPNVTPAAAGIGPAGGTVAGPSGAQVVVPAGALAASTAIAVAQTSVGAPSLPAGVHAAGAVFAFTPHGTTFAVPVTLTVPFDPATVPAGATPQLYKTDATQSAWNPVPGATVAGSSMSGAVGGFSYAVVGWPDVGATLPTEKEWKLSVFDTIDFDRDAQTVLSEKPVEQPQVGGVVNLRFRVGAGHQISPPGVPVDVPDVMAFSDEPGRVFWTSAIAPMQDSEKFWHRARSELTQTFYFEVTEDNPTLHFVVTRAHIESMDFGGGLPTVEICPWMPLNFTSQQLHDACDEAMSDAINRFTLSADSLVDQGTFFSTGGTVEVKGLTGHWMPFVGGWGQQHQLWTEASFDIDPDVGGNSGRWFRMNLKQPITIDVPIKHLHKAGPGREADVFSVLVTVTSDADNRIQGESFVGAFVRDPADSSGIGIDFTGLRPIPPRHDIPTGLREPGCTGGTNAAAGKLQFNAASFHAAERDGEAQIVVERIGGTQGEVSVHVETLDGSAVAGSDYRSVSTVLHFADGEAGTRIVPVPLINDTVAEPDKSIGLVLSRPGGCAALGTRTNATLTLLDDDRPPPVTPTFSVGGTVSGLAGSGLVLRDNGFDDLLPAADGAFTFGSRLNDGAAYAVSIASQPANPAQICSITNGSGTIAAADVVDIRVACTTPPPVGGLDPAFGAQGKVFDGSASASALLLQPDGKLLTLGGMVLARYLADGSADTGFGRNGKVTIVAKGGGLDVMQALALQPDGRILVAGTTSSPTVFNNDFVALRFNADGSPDAGFGTGGMAVTDFAGLSDQAKAVFVLGDGRILVVGQAATGTLSNADQDFAAVRYLSNGQLDTSFGTGGKATLNVAGRSDFVNAAALQADGSIVMVGRVFTDGGSGNSDIGVARLRADGSADAGFGTNGVVRLDFGIGGVVPPGFDGGDWDEALDVAVQPDGRIVLAGYTITAGVFRAALVRLNATGQPDGSFGSNGLVRYAAAEKLSGLALQADGRIVVAGLVAQDFAIARFGASGEIDTGFGSGGLVQVDFFGGFDTALDVQLQPDGRIVAAGAARNGSGRGLGLVRVLP